MSHWQRILSREAWRLWQLLVSSRATAATVTDLSRTLKVSKTKTKAAMLELEENGFLSIQEDT